MEHTFSLMLSSRGGGDGEDTEELAAEIPRLDKIINPLPSYIPETYPEPTEYHAEVMKCYHDFTLTVLPGFQLTNVENSDQLLSFIKTTYADKAIPTYVCDLITHAFLLKCAERLTENITTPSLTRLSLLHHSLTGLRDILKTRQDGSVEIKQQCQMYLAESADVYHNHFCEVVTKHFWGKAAISVKEMVDGMLNREFQRLRLLNKYTFHTLGTLLIRRALESTPNNGKQQMINWGKENGVELD